VAAGDWNPLQNLAAYNLAVEVGNLPAAQAECVQAIRRLRRANSPEVEKWEERLRGVTAQRRAIGRKRREVRRSDEAVLRDEEGR
jgi:hypothetical protein